MSLIFQASAIVALYVLLYMTTRTITPPVSATVLEVMHYINVVIVFTALCVAPTAFIVISSPVVGALLFIVANFSYQAALIYYDSSIKLVSSNGYSGEPASAASIASRIASTRAPFSGRRYRDATQNVSVK